MRYVLTNEGIKVCDKYITELIAKRREILDAGKDTADETSIPSIEDIECDLNNFPLWDGDYFNGWGVTDHFDSDYPLSLEFGKHFTEERETKMREVYIEMHNKLIEYFGIEIPDKYTLQDSLSGWIDVENGADLKEALIDVFFNVYNVDIEDEYDEVAKGE